MPNKLFALKYNNADCLVHVLFTEDNLTINLLNSSLAEELGWNSFTMDYDGNLVNSLSPQNTINRAAALELYELLMGKENEYESSLYFRNGATTLRKTG